MTEEDNEKKAQEKLDKQRMEDFKARQRKQVLNKLLFPNG